ncbi:MerR family transcriptional regulator [Streptomyces sp. NPDC003077]|uniref:DNA polymerase III subunit beta family protein n=1 Tax=Streptomyces sp. NPDC003077 TaxID=3154443 RepID=UPI0033B334D6
MDDTHELLGIGAFARHVGLTPSALRFYDDCGVLRPARVDPFTGYRSYGTGQVARAVRLRRLREAGLRLADTVVVLDGPDDEARAVLRAHLERTRRTADAAREALEEVLHSLSARSGQAAVGRYGRARVGGAELASAVRQVAPAVASGAARDEFPVLGRVLVELDGQEVRLVATDRYRLAVRVLRTEEPADEPCHMLIDAAELKELAAWAVRHAEVGIEVDRDGGARLCAGGECRPIAVRGRGGDAGWVFPDYRLMLDALPSVRHRVITDRQALREAFAGRATGAVVTIQIGGDGGERELVVSGGGGDRMLLPGLLTSVERTPGESVGGQTATLSAEGKLERPGGGEPERPGGGESAVLRIGFDPAVIVPALDAGVGPDVLLELSTGAQPVVIRSADQGSFTTLVMPVKELENGVPASAG